MGWVQVIPNVTLVMLHHYNFLWDASFDKSTTKLHFILIPTMHAKL